MVLKRTFITGSVAVLLAIGCGDGNPTYSGGTASVPDHPGANTPITAANARAATTQAFGALGGAFGRVMTAAASKPALAKVSSFAQSVSNERIDGAASGYINIVNGSYSRDGTTQVLDADIEFNDFSDDGVLYIGGPVSLDLQIGLPGSIDLNNPTAGLTFTYALKGDLAFSGAYQGAMSMDLSVSFNGTLPTISGHVTVDGETVNF